MSNLPKVYKESRYVKEKSRRGKKKWKGDLLPSMLIELNVLRPH